MSLWTQLPNCIYWWSGKQQSSVDPNRFNNRGGQLLKEANERSKLKRELPKVTSFYLYYCEMYRSCFVQFSLSSRIELPYGWILFSKTLEIQSLSGAFSEFGFICNTLPLTWCRSFFGRIAVSLHFGAKICVRSSFVCSTKMIYHKMAQMSYRAHWPQAKFHVTLHWMIWYTGLWCKWIVPQSKNCLLSEYPVVPWPTPCLWCYCDRHWCLSMLIFCITFH